MKHITKMNSIELKEFSNQLKGKKRKGSFMFPCGHNTGYQMPLYPFEWVCSKCGLRHTKIFKECGINDKSIN